MPAVVNEALELDNNVVFKNLGLTDYYDYSSTSSGGVGDYPTKSLPILIDSG
jgi:predicted alpha/beta-fold hydrolase